MNVEFEYQIRHSLKGFLQFTDDKAPPPGAVEQQNLDAPSADAPVAAPAAAPTPVPRPSAPAAVPFSSPAPTVLAP